MIVNSLQPQKPSLRGEFSVCKLKHQQGRQGRLAEPGTYDDHYSRPPASSHTPADCQDSDSDTALPGKTTATKSENMSVSCSIQIPVYCFSIHWFQYPIPGNLIPVTNLFVHRMRSTSEMMTVNKDSLLPLKRTPSR